MKTILLAGAGGNAAINFADSLRMAPEKMRLVGIDCNKWHLEQALCDEKYLFPKCSDPAYLEKLNSIISKEGADLFHPQPDVEVFFASENREKINAKTFLPDKKTVRLCQDKNETAKTLASNGVPVPKSVAFGPNADLKSAFEELGTETVWVRAIKGAGSRAALPVKSAKQARNWMDYWIEFKGLKENDFMLSEYLPGREFAFQSIWKNGELVTSQARERLEYIFGNITPSGQTSSPSVAITVSDERVNQTAHDAVLAADKNATGVFCVDMKENSKGEPCATEINAGRFFTTSNFFSKAGANMPLAYVKMALGEDAGKLPKFNSLPAGIYWIRTVDQYPTLLKGNEWTSKKA